MLIGVIADDFTGASDIANTLAKGWGSEGGLRTAQYAGIPTVDAKPAIDAGVISLKSRTAPVNEAVDDSLSALRWLKDQGCKQFVFKYCSTFDSTRTGNIGPVAEALANELAADRVLFCPAFPTNGRTVYQGHLFVWDRPLNESGMERHPLTPMTDSDIRRWLGHQSTEPVGHLAHPTVAKGSDAVRRELAKAETRFSIADAISDDDLLTLGKALHDAPLVTGGSGIALGLPGNFIRSGATAVREAVFAGHSGPEAILVGSCSGATLAQVRQHAENHPSLAIDVRQVMRGDLSAADLAAFFKANAGLAPLAYSSGLPDDVQQVQKEFGREVVAKTLDTLFADTAALLIEQGYKRLVVAGGETSGAVARSVSSALDAPEMTIGPEIDPGVPVLGVGGSHTVALALKSGNFGSLDFFSKALRVMEIGH